MRIAHLFLPPPSAYPQGRHPRAGDQPSMGNDSWSTVRRMSRDGSSPDGVSTSKGGLARESGHQVEENIEHNGNSALASEPEQGKEETWSVVAGPKG